MSMHPVPSRPESSVPTAALRASTDEVWQRLVTDWLPGWLQVESIPRVVGGSLRGLDGTAHGRVLGCHVGHRVRLEWGPTAALLDVAVAPVTGGARLTVRLSPLEGHEQGGDALTAQNAELWQRRLHDLEATMARTTGPIPVVPDVLAGV